jgi:hypothetical protein
VRNAGKGFDNKGKKNKVKSQDFYNKNGKNFQKKTFNKKKYYGGEDYYYDNTAYKGKEETAYVEKQPYVSKNKKKQRPNKPKKQEIVHGRSKGILLDYDDIINQQKGEAKRDVETEPVEESKHVAIGSPSKHVETHLETIREEKHRNQHHKDEITFEPEFRDRLMEAEQRDRFNQYQHQSIVSRDFNKSPYANDGRYRMNEHIVDQQQRPKHYDEFRGGYHDPRDRYYEQDPRYRYPEHDYRDRYHEPQEYNRYYDNRERHIERINPPINNHTGYRTDPLNKEPILENNDRLRDKLVNITNRSNGHNSREEDVKDVNKTNLDSLRNYFDRLRKVTTQVEDNNGGKSKTVGGNYVFER